MKAKSITGATGTRVDPEKFTVMKDALREVVPTRGDGLTLDEMKAALARKVPEAMFPKGPGWYMMSTKLHMEAEGEIVRVPGSKPLRHLLIRKS